ncbi:HNH endonuclease [Halalkalibacter wakoensis]|uniref:HNH endonuclease n=1 Tax=Halalkalibacter wakoensis TaxID=127891 RepID=UPI00055155E1|nr:HNH endonuclease [Halalkalibacter wakoensis]
MANKPKRKCHKTSCRNLTAEKYCDEHSHLAEEDKKNRHKFYDRYKRDQKAKAFYLSKEWELTREAALRRDHYLCQHCLRNKLIQSADMVHHIKTVKSCWHLRLVLRNLISLCNSCHGKIDHS